MYRTRLARIADLRNSTRAGMMTLPEEGNFFTYFFFRDKMPIDINMLVFFLGKCVRTASKCCELRCCADQVRSRTDNKNEVLEGKFSDLNFSSFTKKTTE